MGKSRFIELMAKSMDKSASEEELRALELFLEQYSGYKKVHQVTNVLKSKLKQPEDNLKEEEINQKLDELWVNIKNSGGIATEIFTESRPVTINYWQWVASAAAVLLVSTLGFVFYKNYQQSKKQLNVTIHRVDVPYGRTVKVTLTDGTVVKLNAGSHFSYPEAFANNQREVTLDGEGFFEVTKNAKKPFLVHTTGLTVRVLGTVFNVRAYKEDKKTETTLLKGKVEVELKDDPDKKIILSPHEKLTVLNDVTPTKTQGQTKQKAAKLKYELSVLPVVNNDEYQENAWLDNKIVFTNEDFEDVAVQMERKYKVHIVFEDEMLKKEQMSGVLQNENLESTLLILKQIISFKTKTEGGTVYITR